MEISFINFAQGMVPFLWNRLTIKTTVANTATEPRIGISVEEDDYVPCLYG
jgi:hypothetical protein